MQKPRFPLICDLLLVYSKCIICTHFVFIKRAIKTAKQLKMIQRVNEYANDISVFAVPSDLY